MKGFFIVNGMRIPNTILDNGVESLLTLFFRDSAATLDLVDNEFFLGLMGLSYTSADDLATIELSEPEEDHGYARIVLEQSAVGFPSIAKVNGVWRAQSKVCTFQADAGEAFSVAVQRSFIANRAKGEAGGKALMVSAALPAPMTVTDTNVLSISYELWIN